MGVITHPLNNLFPGPQRMMESTGDTFPVKGGRSNKRRQTTRKHRLNYKKYP